METRRTPKFPGPDHPITLEPTPGRVTVRLGEQSIADTRNALVMHESTLPPVQYVPRNDVDMSLLERTSHTTY